MSKNKHTSLTYRNKYHWRDFPHITYPIKCMMGPPLITSMRPNTTPVMHSNGESSLPSAAPSVRHWQKAPLQPITAGLARGHYMTAIKNAWWEPEWGQLVESSSLFRYRRGSGVHPPNHPIHIPQGLTHFVATHFLLSVPIIFIKM